MSDITKDYCRLCAESWLITEMLSPDKDIMINAKIITKLSWINIDICAENGLPNTICYACLDSLERTWSFLNNVRTAHEKLVVLLLKTAKNKAHELELENKDNDHIIPGKPVDENWEIFQDLKHEIKIETLNDSVHSFFPNDTVVISNENQMEIKLETNSDDDDDDNELDHFSTDSDVPLKQSIKKKHGRTKHKKTKENPALKFITWDNQSCICAKCDMHCPTILQLQLHSLQIHDSCCSFKCTQCSKVLPGYRSFVRHMRTHIKSLKHCCEYCNRSFIYLQDLSSHKMEYHKAVYKTKCSNCGSNFSTAEELDEHKSLFSKIPKLKRISNGEGRMEHKCDQCNKVFKTRTNLQQHKLLHSEDRSKDFACHICGKMFYTKGTLGTHLVVHEEKRPFKCIHCPLAFRAKGNLASHLSLHTGLKPFVCEQCGKSFRVKRHLISHSIVHTDLRPYNCEYCNKSFRFKTRLNLHLRQHTGVRPYKCIYCQRDFTNGSNFKKHMKRRHGIDTSTRILAKVVSKKEISVVSEAEQQ